MYGLAVARRGFSAREEPSALEAKVARAARSFSIPTGARELKNPLAPLSPQALSEARAHWGIIQNGIRLTGMPAWGQAHEGAGNNDSWALVGLIRRLPRLSPEELGEIKAALPQSWHELEECAAGQVRQATCQGHRDGTGRHRGSRASPHPTGAGEGPRALGTLRAQVPISSRARVSA